MLQNSETSSDTLWTEQDREQLIKLILRREQMRHQVEKEQAVISLRQKRAIAEASKSTRLGRMHK